ncbi:MAG: hypothetical protein KDE53_31530, partial [Caldilineaceae bacterium]|nr:hypothetical protein [Caldilineaceae bacterium]
MNNDRTAIDEIKRKLTLKQVIDKFGGAQLRGDGDQLVGWHSVHESTSKSSLEVDNKKGVYHCFGCKEGGDMFDWVGHVKFNSRYDRTDGAMFGEVLRDLAAFAGVELPERNAEKVAERRSIEEIWQLAADYYHAELTQQHRDYLHSRYGLTDGVIDTLKIGFAPKGERNLLGHLVKNHKIDGDELVKTGLFHRFDNGNIQDHFQGRIIFPYWVNERPVYFIGRETADSPQWEKDKGHMKYKKLLVHNDKHPYVSEAVRND